MLKPIEEKFVKTGGVAGTLCFVAVSFFGTSKWLAFEKPQIPQETPVINGAS